ncbi:MAG: NYN domain-containing protein, partial [Candidatus Dormibacteraceae bacterium]
LSPNRSAQTIPLPSLITTERLPTYDGGTMKPVYRHLLVDGSNIAHEGRAKVFSFEQLQEAVTQLRSKYPDVPVTVFVDAGFRHALSPDEVDMYDSAVREEKLLVTPAGVDGKGDSYILSQACLTSGTVVSNDSYQQFQAEHPWLLDKDRVLGAGRGPGGWSFLPRYVVRSSRDKNTRNRLNRASRIRRRSPQRQPSIRVPAEERRTRVQAPPKPNRHDEIAPTTTDWDGEAQLRRFEEAFRRANEQETL